MAKDPKKLDLTHELNKRLAEVAEERGTTAEAVIEKSLALLNTAKRSKKKSVSPFH